MPTLLALSLDNSLTAFVPGLAAELGVPLRTFGDVAAFFADGPPDGPACLIASVDAIDPRGREVARMQTQWPSLGMVMIGSNLSQDLVIALTRAGVVDVLSEPIDRVRACRSIREALERSAAIEDLSAEADQVMRRLDGLTARELQVLRMIASGHSSKSAAVELSISKRTVDYHRRQIMLKTSTKSATELVDLAHRGELLQYRRQARIHGLPPLSGRLSS